MVSVRNRLGESIRALMGIKPPAPSAQAVKAIREAMLKLLGDRAEARHPQLHTRLHQIHDAQGLWHARVELFAHLSEQQGKAHAQACMGALLPLFKGQIPKALMSGNELGRGTGRSSQRR